MPFGIALSSLLHYLVLAQHICSTRYTLIVVSSLNLVASLHNTLHSASHFQLFSFTYQVIRFVVSSVSLFALYTEWLQLLVLISFLFELLFVLMLSLLVLEQLDSHLNHPAHTLGLRWGVWRALCGTFVAALIYISFVNVTLDLYRKRLHLHSSSDQSFVTSQPQLTYVSQHATP